MDRILRGSRSKIQITLYDGETPVDATGLPTVEVLREDGTVVVVAGTNTTDEPGTGIYSYTLTPAHTADLDVLTARWTATISGSSVVLTTQVEVVGGFYFGLAELRALPGLAGQATRFTTAEMIAARTWAEALIEGECRTSFVRRYARDLVDGSGTTELHLATPYPSEILSVKVDGVALTAGELADLAVYSDGTLVRKTLGSFASGQQNVSVRYGAGRTDFVPADLKEAALGAARARVISANGETGMPRSTRSITNEAGTMTFGYAGNDHPTGIDDVDAVIVRWRNRVRIPGLA